MSSSRAALAIVLTLSFQLAGFSQQPQNDEKSGVAEISQDFVRTERQLWTSPLRIEHKDLRWLLPLGLSAAALLATDRQISAEAAEAPRLRHPSQIVSQAGSIAPAAIPLGLYLLGRAAHDDRAARAGGAGIEAFLHSALIVQALKTVTNRERPSKARGDGGFWDGGKSFPSGHAMSAWAFAAALSDLYPDKKWVGITGYGLAGAVSMARVGGLNHFPSDVVVGSSLGWLIGHYVSRHHTH